MTSFLDTIMKGGGVASAVFLKFMYNKIGYLEKKLDDMQTNIETETAKREDSQSPIQQRIQTLDYFQKILVERIKTLETRITTLEKSISKYKFLEEAIKNKHEELEGK